MRKWSFIELEGASGPPGIAFPIERNIGNLSLSQLKCLEELLDRYKSVVKVNR